MNILKHFDLDSYSILYNNNASSHIIKKGAALAAALVDQLMADVDSLSMSSIVPGSLRKSNSYTYHQHHFRE